MGAASSCIDLETDRAASAMFNAHPELHNRYKDVTGSLCMLGSRLAPKILSATGRAAVSHHVKMCRSGENRRTRRSRARRKF